MRLILATSIAGALALLTTALWVVTGDAATRAYNVSVRPGSVVTVTWPGNQRQFVIPEGVTAVRVTIQER